MQSNLTGGARAFLGGMSHTVSTRELTIATWNVAAINNVRTKHDTAVAAAVVVPVQRTKKDSHYLVGMLCVFMRLYLPPS
jgi:hypothetical protein